MMLTAAKRVCMALPGSPVHHAAPLGALAFLAALLLASADLFTREAIEARGREDLRAGLGQVIPQTLHDNDLLKDQLAIPLGDGQTQKVFRALKEGRVVAVAFPLETQGYGGTIRLLMGVDTAGRILGVRVLAHRETPGLGDWIELGKSRWVLSFDGLSLGNPDIGGWAVKKDGGRFDQFSGATITPRVVVTAVRDGLAFFTANRGALLSPPEPLSGAGT